MTEPFCAFPPPREWAEPARWLRSAQCPSTLDREAWVRAIDELRRHGLAPLFADRVLKADAELPAEVRTLLQREEARAKANYSALMAGVERVLGTWADAGMAPPYVLKGLHLAHTWYPAPHLRPMADADVLFPNLRDGERAWGLARDLGLAPQGVPMSSNPWLGAHELPMLVDPATGFTLEIQGSLVFTTGDRRAARAARLLEDPLRWTLCGRTVLGMKPEALLVYLFAHAFIQHETALGTRLYALQDGATILERAGESLEWERLIEHSMRTQFAGATGLGLAWTRSLLGSAIPEGVLEKLASSARGFKPGAVRGNGAEVRQDALTLGEFLHQTSWRAAFELLWTRVCPTGAYMRHRYPPLARWPLAFLYPHRWAHQMARGVTALWKNRQPSSSGTKEGGAQDAGGRVAQSP